MARNTLEDMNNHLFAQMERLTDEGMDEKEFQKEIQRSKALTGLAAQAINNAKIALDAAKFAGSGGKGGKKQGQEVIKQLLKSEHQQDEETETIE